MFPNVLLGTCPLTHCAGFFYSTRPPPDGGKNISDTYLVLSLNDQNSLPIPVFAGPRFLDTVFSLISIHCAASCDSPLPLGHDLPSLQFLWSPHRFLGVLSLVQFSSYSFSTLFCPPLSISFRCFRGTFLYHFVLLFGPMA